MKTRWSLFPRHQPSSAAGFTFFEILVIMAVILLLAVLAVSNFEVTLKRAKLQGDATSIANAIQRARAIAVRRSKSVVVEIDKASLDLIFFFDDNQNFTFDPPAEVLAMPSLTLSTGNTPDASVRFWSRDQGPTPDVDKAMDKFTTRVSKPPVIVIKADGSIRDLGGIRIGMGPDPSADYFDGNFMEVRVVTEATGRTEIRKLIPTDLGDPPPYEPRKQTANGPNWKFY